MNADYMRKTVKRNYQKNGKLLLRLNSIYINICEKIASENMNSNAPTLLALEIFCQPYDVLYDETLGETFSLFYGFSIVKQVKLSTG